MQIDIDGTEYYANTGGHRHVEGQPCLVFIHGAGMDHSTWALYNRYFASNGFNTLAIDLPGHGYSGGRPLETVEDMAAWLCRLLDTREVANFSLLGHSLGSLVALEVASRMAGRISRLLLLGTAVPMPVGEPLLSAARAGSHDAVDMIMLYGHAYASQLGGNPVPGIHIVNSSMRLIERALDGLLFTDLNACHTYQNGLHAAAETDAPCSLILGREDKMTPPAAVTSLQETLSSCEVIYIEGCGHMMLSEKPEQVHRAMCRALR